MERESGYRDGHYRQLRPFREAQDLLLGEDGGETVGEGREEDVGQDERAGGEAHENRLRAFIREPSDHGEACERLEEVVVRHAEEVRGEERKE